MKWYHFLLMLSICNSNMVSSASAQTKDSIDVLAVLKKSPAYNKEQKQNFPDFNYQSPNEPHLAELRKTFNLDSVAGKGTDVSRAIRLLEWMHNTVPHADVANLDTLNAMNIIRTYQMKKHAQGCYGLSISMNEIFLSMGFKSRSVICFSNLYPRSRGGHVINSLYLESLNKWVWMDPQENAYVMDEKGNLLGISEVRERLINNRPLVLNKTANYHNIPTKKEDYLYKFMAEHLYRMICPLNSEYNSQTRIPAKVIKYVELLPVGSKEPAIDGFETQYNKRYEVISYHTNNDQLFWKQP